MKTDDLVTILAGAVLAYIAFKTLKPSGSGFVMPALVKSINVGNTAGTDAAGWQYFTDGTAISPNGDYYYQGSLVYKAQA